MVNVLLIGSGGREHALAKALTRNGNTRLYAALKTENPGILSCAESFLMTESDAARIVDFCRVHQIDFCVVGPESVLNAGITDTLSRAGFPSAAPTRMAARIETDKAYMRDLLDRYGIPGQVRYCQTSRAEEAESFARALEWRVAVKPTGLTSGKGVRVWGDHIVNELELLSYVNELLTSDSIRGAKVLLEQFWEGQEFTLHFYCDGENAVSSPLIQDYKRAYEENRGPNTGGMGAHSCKDGLLSFVSLEHYSQACHIGRRVFRALAEEGHPFTGVLYGQFMVTSDGLKVIEFNARFGDPEAINALGILETDFAVICKAMVTGKLADIRMAHRKSATVTAYLVPTGYPADPAAGQRITLDEQAIEDCGAEVFYGSCRLLARENRNVTIETTKSRTLALYSNGETPDIARARVLKAIRTVQGSFDYRADIGAGGR